MNQKELWRKQTNERRQRQIKALGIDEVRLREREKKRRQRAKNKPEDAVSKSHDVEQLMNEITDEIRDYTLQTIGESNDNKVLKVKSDIPKVIKKKQLLNIKTIDSLEDFVSKLSLDSLKNDDKPIKIQTLKDYAERLRLLHEFMFKNKPINFNNLEWLRDISKVKKSVLKKMKKDTSALSYVIGITGILGRIMDFEQEYEEYRKFQKELKKKVGETKGKSLLTDQEKKNYLDYDELKGLKTNSERKEVLKTLYLDLPPRRNEDYMYMIVLKQKKVDVDNLPENMNYYIPHTNQLVFKKYKTSKDYNQMVVNLDDKKTDFINYPKVKKIMKKYSQKFEDGDYLFGTKKNTPYKNFTQEVQKVFTKGKKKPTVNILRHAFISNMFKKNPTLKDKQTIAYIMGHSLYSQAEYNRLV